MLDAGRCRHARDRDRRRSRRTRPTAAIFLNKRRALRASASGWCRRTSAQTLRADREAGAAGFYKGPVGAAIVASSQAGKGIITQADLDQYTTRELAPVECDYRGYRIVSAPPPSSGGVIICEILNVLEGYPLKDWGFRSAQAVHVPDRGDAPRLRRPQQLPRRSGLRQEPARPPARQGLRREDPRRDRPDEGRRLART